MSYVTYSDYYDSMDAHEAYVDECIERRWQGMVEFYSRDNDEGAREAWLNCRIDVTDPDYSLSDVSDEDLDVLIDVFQYDYDSPGVHYPRRRGF